MPDGDHFERKLRGKGWRSVYRLGCCDAPIEAVADKILGAVANVLRTEGTDWSRDIYKPLYKSLRQALNLFGSGPLFREAVSQQAFNELASSAEAIVADAGHSEVSRLAERAALRTFSEMEQSGEVTDEALKQGLTKNFILELTERRCLSAVRDGIMRSTGRDQQRQLAWEGQLGKAVVKPCVALSRSLLSEDGTRAIRAPKKLFKPKPVTMESLDEPLRVLGDLL